MKRRNRTKTRKVEKTIAPNRTYKARIFEMVFSDKKELLALYNAVNKTHYDDPELLEINTLQNAIYMSMKNDVSFIIDSRLSLYEHQSTYSPNLPIRYLLYVADIYANITRNENLYGTKKIEIPPPRFLIFYNGREPYPERKILKLSDLYVVDEEEVSLELTALMLNINPGHNEELMNTCKTLRDYAEYTERVRRYAETMKLEDAVERSITECIREGILAEFLSKNRAEAKRMSIYEYDEERHMRQTRAEGYEDGEAAGMIKGEAIGRQQGMDQINQLTILLAEQNRTEDIIKAANDPEYQKKLLEEFSL
ncbi:MAG: hypothetical protein ACI4TF_04685 [Oliverpabstia sp.]